MYFKDISEPISNNKSIKLLNIIIFLKKFTANRKLEN